MLDWIQTHIPPWFYITLIVHFTILGSVAYLILLERKVASWVQDRIGPNRTGLGFGIVPFLKDFHFWGLGQPLADGLKFIVKEDYRAKNVDKVLFTLAPGLMIVVIIISIAVIPWGGMKQATRDVVLGPVNDVNNLDGKAIMDRAHAGLAPGSKIVGTPLLRTAEGELRNGSVYEVPNGIESQTYTVATVNYRYAFQIADLNIGVLFVLAILSLAVYGVVIGGWASNNKYSFLGGLRATANMISYEIPLGLAILVIVVLFGTLDMGTIVERQAHYWLGVIPAWNVFHQPLAFLLFLICIHAEANRAPFDMAEAEQELVGGYHTEYSSMRFALFFLAEYAGMITTSAVGVALFFGGWHLPGLDRAVIWFTNLFGANNAPIDPAQPAVTTSLVLCVIRSLVFFGKTMAIIFVFMWVRWSLPRFRFDQLMMIAWRGLIPISLAMLMVTAVVVYLFRDSRPANLWVDGRMALALLVANTVLLAGTVLVSLVIPPAPATNRRVRVANSRFNRTPLPGGARTAPALNKDAATALPVSPVPAVTGRVGS